MRATRSQIRGAPTDRRVTVVGLSTGDDRDDHRVAGGRELEGELGPRAVALPHDQRARIECGPEFGLNSR